METTAFFTVIILVFLTHLSMSLKTKRKLTSFIGPIFFAVLAGVFVVLSFSITGWDTLVYIVFASLSGGLCAVCTVSALVALVLKRIIKTEE